MKRLVLIAATLAMVLFALVTSKDHSTGNDDSGNNDDNTNDDDDSDNYECSDAGFANWGKKHKKHSDNDDDDRKKKARNNWKSLCNTVKDHNEKYERGEVSYKLALNSAADKSKEELMARRGYIPSSDDVPSRRKKRAASYTTYYYSKSYGLKNSSVNWNGTILVGPVLDQTYCASCWAFAGIASLEAAYAKKYGKFIKASEQNIIDCANYDAGYGDAWGCNGGGVGSVWNYVVANGVNSNASYPNVSYDAVPPNYTCNYNKSNNVPVTQSSFQYVDRNETTLAQALARFGPIAVCIATTYPDFDYYSDGIYNNLACKQSSISHCVLLVGYGKYMNTDVWLIKNSWGKGWGINGFGYMLRGVDICWITYSAQFPNIR